MKNRFHLTCRWAVFLCVWGILLAFLTACASPGPTSPAAASTATASPQTQTPVASPTHTVLAPTTAAGAAGSMITPGAAFPTGQALPEGPIITGPGELTLNQSQAINPPPPSGLKALQTARGIQLSWEAPPAVSVPHHYSDTILYYRVYRRSAGGEFAFLAQSAKLTYLDQSAAPGTQYAYTVTAMHEREIESLRPNEVSVP